MMIPTRIYLKGFMSYRDEATIRFDGAHLWVLSGPNGSGKSAIFDAITFALYGTYRGVSRRPKDLINHQRDELVVEFDFFVDEEEYRVKRTVSRRGSSTRQAFALGSSNPEPVAGTDGDQGFKEWVNDLIGLDYDAFTSSVILLQGESEKLLRQEPRKRHEILSKLIDLSPYERLHAASGERRQHHRSLSTEYGDQLRNTPFVGEEELRAAQGAAERSEQEWREAGDRVEDLVQLVERAREWGRLAGDLASRREEAEEARKLLRREDEIQVGYERLQEIKQNLPTVESFVSYRDRLKRNERRESEIREQSRGLGREIERAEAEKETALREVDRLAALAEGLGFTDANLSEKAHELSRKTDYLKRLEETQAEWDEAKLELDSLPTDLEQTLKDTEKEAERLAEAERALPWLKHLAQSRLLLKQKIDAERDASEGLEALRPRLQQREEECERLAADVEEARENKGALLEDVTRTRTRCDDARQRRAGFEDVSAQPTCERCGQEITQEHVARETAQLDGCVAETEAELRLSTSRYEEAAHRVEGLEEKLRAAIALREGSLGERNRLEGEHRRSAEEALQLAGQATNAFGNLPPSYRSRVAPVAPEGNTWASTVYPTVADLEEAQESADGKEAHAELLRSLREQLGQKQRWDESCRTSGQRLSKLLETYSWEDVRGARGELKACEDCRGELRLEIAQLKKAHQESTKKAKECGATLEKLTLRVSEGEAELKALRAARQEIKHALEADLARLPENWKKQAESAGAEELAGWREERENLDGYDALFTEMQNAGRSLKEFEEHIAELESRIAGMPEKARRLHEEVEAELSEARSLAEDKDAERRSAGDHFGQLQRRRDWRLELEKLRREAERQHGAYGTLCTLLGPRGLQGRLLRAAELELVALANEVLDRLSRGRMTLALREEDQHRALDLVVFDNATGTSEIAVNLTSGSQRFRIAVSLALAIGRYKGQRARRIQSVIVDEGFGSLDKNSRDDMIQVLNDLRQELDKIILVSHQEEFANAFTNGYAVSLKDNSSKVEILQS